MTLVLNRSRLRYQFRTSVNLPESLGRTSTLQASLVVSEMVEPYGSSNTEPELIHSKVPSMFSAAAPEGAQRLSVNLSLVTRTIASSQKALSLFY